MLPLETAPGLNENLTGKPLLYNVKRVKFYLRRSIRGLMIRLQTELRQAIIWLLLLIVCYIVMSILTIAKTLAGFIAWCAESMERICDQCPRALLTATSEKLEG